MIPLKKMQSLIALCNKQIRILFGILKKGYEFSEEKMMQDIPRFEELSQALKTLREMGGVTAEHMWRSKTPFQHNTAIDENRLPPNEGGFFYFVKITLRAEKETSNESR